jgi:Zn-dependent protease with chaperone function/tetratricopeptide (TPR) repeat protein
VAWFHDRSGATEPLDDACEAFIAQQARADAPRLPDWLSNDPAAWVLLGRSDLDKELTETGQVEPARAEAACRQAMKLDESFAPAHSNLAVALIVGVLEMKEPEKESAKWLANSMKKKRLAEAAEEIETAGRLNADLRPAYLWGMHAFAQGHFGDAEKHFREALQDYPNSKGGAGWYLQSLFAQEDRPGPWAEHSAPLVERFPDDGRLRVLHAMALVRDREFRLAAEQLTLARAKGAEPETLLGAETVARIQSFAVAMTPALAQAVKALDEERFEEAGRHFRDALAEHPENAEIALGLSHALLAAQRPDGAGAAVSSELGELCRRFPQEGKLHALHAVALAREQDYAGAVAAMDQAEDLGVDMNEVLGAEVAAQVRRAGEPSLLARFLWIMAFFGIAYAAAIASMAGAGAVLSAATPRVPDATHEAAGPAELISRRESFLERLYMLMLVVGLLLFYVSIPFVVVGLLALTAGIVFAMLMAPVISIKLLIIVVIVGLGMGWAVLKSIFASHRSGTFGMKKTEQDCPRLHASLREVAQKTATDAIDDVYIAPGSAIGVHQEGRGPFGMFGVKRRVLTLGLSTMHYLTISELKAILAHEYAHFSHRDTVYSRFIYQVTLSIENALMGMAQFGGSVNYVNPFYWFFWLYYRAYSLLASSFSRSREFLADRMAVRLYGKKAFVSGLTKVATDGAFFEASIYHNISSLLSQGKSFVNMYEAFRAHRDAGLSAEQRQTMYSEMLKEKASWFHTHPTYAERVQATIGYPDAPEAEDESALKLFEDPDALEREMTEYLTQYIYAVQVLQAQAAAQEQ